MNYPNFFSQGSPYLSHPLLTTERTAKEVGFVLSQLNLAPGARLLDVGCGPGRHSIELASRGYDVLGIDPSQVMIEAARSRAAEMGVAPVFRQIAGEAFVAKDAYDAAICLFTTLGQISASGENSALVAKVYDALRPGGWFVVETPQRESVIKNLKLAERFGAGERYTDVTRSINRVDNTVSEVFEVVSPSAARRYLLRYRLYSQAELIALLQEAGFRVQASYGDYDGNPLVAASAAMLMFGRKSP